MKVINISSTKHVRFYNDIILISIKDEHILIQFRLNSPLELSPVVNNDASGVNRYCAGVR